MESKNKIFPFEFVSLSYNNNTKKPFIKTVEDVLTSNLQSSDSIGCKIEDCHTHAGSKVHFDDFIEAELLFHNSYYNRGFSILSAKKIQEKIQFNKNKGKIIQEIILIGYENYCELFLQDLRWRINDKEVATKKISCDWCVYETIKSKDSNLKKSEAHIRNLSVDEIGNYVISYQGENSHCIDLDKALFVFIVPINTTLSTMDKMVAKFREIKNTSKVSSSKLSTQDIQMDLICLITIGNINDKNDTAFWSKKQDDDKENYILFPKENLTAIQGKEILTFSYVESSWQDAKNCTKCFPSSPNDLKKEEVLFGVNRSSVVPMLRIGDNATLKPFDDASVNKERENIARLMTLSKYLIYDHIVRNENHYQFYFNTVAYFESIIRSQKLKKELDEDIQKFRLILNKTQVNKIIGIFEKNIKDLLNDEELRLNFIFHMDKFKKSLWEKITNNEAFDIDACIRELSYLTERVEENELLEKINQELKDFKKDLNSIFETKSSEIIYDYIVSPRHISNSGWVHYVKEKLFENNEVRIFYFDVDKEYRSNIKAKYSDFIQSIKNIRRNDEKCTIRIHFVDDAIYSGNSFLRTQNILSSLLDGLVVKNVQIKLFYSIILLVGRISSDTKKFYLDSLWSEALEFYENDKNIVGTDTIQRFYCFSELSISPMRKFDDSCTLCRLEYDFNKIMQFCSSNRLAQLCLDTIERHKMQDFIYFEDKREKFDRIEKRFLLMITHALNQRMKNKHYFEKESNQDPFNYNAKESREIIQRIIEDYFKSKPICDKLSKDEGISTDFGNFLYEIAFIKAISRPFFINHIRQRQAVFSFCIEQLNNIIFSQEEEERQIHKLCLVGTLVKALSDLEANYLIRKEILDKLQNLAQKGDEIKADGINDFYNKEWIGNNILTSNILLLCFKKLLILSRETTKSIYLEYILILNKEPVFENQNLSNIIGENHTNKKPHFADNYLLRRLYLENNRVIGSALQEVDNTLNIIDENNKPYFLDHLDEIWKVNTAKSIYNQKEVLEAYKCLKKELNEGKNKLRDLDMHINNLFASISKEDYLTSTSFVYDKKSKNNLFKIFMLELDETSWKDKNKLSRGRDFYHSDNIELILKMLDNNDIDIVIEEENILLRFASNSINDNNDMNDNNEIYLEIKGFSSSKIEHWFAIKILLTLRLDFADLIDRINIPNIVKSRNIDIQRRALSIDKALIHSSAAQTQGYYDNYKHPYFQRLANEFISSVYRSIIKGQPQTSKPVLYSDLSINLLKIFEKDSNRENIYISKIGKYGKEEEIKIEIELSAYWEKNKETMQIMQWGFTGFRHTIPFLIVLMAMNAHKYAVEENGKKTIKILFKDEYISFINKVEENFDINKIYTTLKTPPWCYEEEDQSITLWTLYNSSVSEERRVKNRFKSFPIELKKDPVELFVSTDGDNQIQINFRVLLN